MHKRHFAAPRQTLTVLGSVAELVNPAGYGKGKEMRGLTFTVALMLILAPAASAQGFDGTYAIGDCSAPGDGAMVLAGATITFYESACRLSNPTVLTGFDDAVMYDASCAGEGETWKEKLLMMPALSGGLVVVSPGWATVYERCQ